MQAAEWLGFIGASFCTLCLEVWRGRERERVEILLIIKAKRDEVLTQWDCYKLEYHCMSKLAN